MLFGKAMFKRFHHSWSRDGTGNEGDADRLEGLWGKSLRGETSPKTVPVAGHSCEASNSVVANEIIDFAALNICGAVIPSTKSGFEARVSRAWPSHSQARRQILRIGAHV